MTVYKDHRYDAAEERPAARSDIDLRDAPLNGLSALYWRERYEKAPRPLTVILGWIWGFAMGLGTAALIWAVR